MMTCLAPHTVRIFAALVLMLSAAVGIPEPSPAATVCWRMRPNVRGDAEAIQSIAALHRDTTIPVHLDLSGSALDDMTGTPVKVWMNNTGVFVALCKMNWKRYHRAPHKLSFFKKVQVASGCGDFNGVTCVVDPSVKHLKMCTEARQHTLPVLPLRVVRLSEALQASIRSATSINASMSMAASATRSRPLLLDPSMFVHHVGRSGSTLIANTFGALTASPVLVLVEDKVTNKLLTRPFNVWQSSAVAAESPDSAYCEELAAALIRGVMWLQALSPAAFEGGRKRKGKRKGFSRVQLHERIVYKFEPHHIFDSQALQAAFPQAPSLFNFRQPVPVVWSFMKVKDEVLNPRGIYCVRHRWNPRKEHVRQYRATWPAVAEKTDDEIVALLKVLPLEEFCALHCATLQQAALDSFAGQSGAPLLHPVPYSALPSPMWEHIVPQLLVPAPQRGGQPLVWSEEEAEKMRRTSRYNSKKPSREVEFVPDTHAKEEAASQIVQDVAAMYMQRTYDELQQLFVEQGLLGHQEL